MAKETEREYTDDELRKAQVVLDGVHDVMVGQGRLLQATVLAALSAQWINGHSPEVREEMLLKHIRAVRYFMEHSQYREPH